jgi:hypothetical protein
MRTKILLILASVGLSLTSVAHGACPEGQVDFKKAITNAFIGQVDAAKDAASEKTTIPSDRQLAAPSGSGSGSSVADHASFPSLLGGALDQGLINAGQGTATVNLNFFAFEALVHPEFVTDQVLYAQHSLVRRFGGAITLGGKGQGFDGEGNVLSQAGTAKDLGDIVDGEIRFRFRGNTDRRDGSNAARMTAAAKTERDKAQKESVSFELKNASEMEKLPACGSADQVKAFLQEHKKDISTIASSVAAAQKTLEAEGKKIDQQQVWSFVAGGTRRKTEFGLDSVRAGFRGELGKVQDHQNTLNLDWTRSAALPNGLRPTTLKLAFEHSYRWKSGSTFAPDGIDISASLSVENDRDVPDAQHPSNVKANIKFEYPISKSMKIPVSLSWANHEDLLTGEKNIRGHIGFTVDFSKLGAAADASKPSS